MNIKGFSSSAENGADILRAFYIPSNISLLYIECNCGKNRCYKFMLFLLLESKSIIWLAL